MTANNTSDVLNAFGQSVSSASNLRDVFGAAETAAQTSIGHRLFTVMRFDATRMMVERLYSSNPEVYPIGGRKPKGDSEWRRHVLEEGKVFIGHNSDDIRWVFDDSELILNLGLHAVLNVPIKSSGRIVGTMNLLDRTAHYTAQDAETGTEIAHQLAHVIDSISSASD